MSIVVPRISSLNIVHPHGLFYIPRAICNTPHTPRVFWTILWDSRESEILLELSTASLNIHTDRGAS